MNFINLNQSDIDKTYQDFKKVSIMDIGNNEPNFTDGVKSWIYAGGGHHTVVTLSLSAEQIYDWSKMVNLKIVIIDHDTKLRDIISQTTR